MVEHLSPGNICFQENKCFLIQSQINIHRLKERGREAERQRGREAERKRGREAERERGRKAERLRGREGGFT